MTKKSFSVTKFNKAVRMVTKNMTTKQKAQARAYLLYTYIKFRGVK